MSCFTEWKLPAANLIIRSVNSVIKHHYIAGDELGMICKVPYEDIESIVWRYPAMSCTQQHCQVN